PTGSASAAANPLCSPGSTTLTANGGGAPALAYSMSSVAYSAVSFTPTGTFNSGTTPTSGSNDDGYYTVSIPFTFTLYGTAYTSCNIGTNGYVCFGSGMTSTSISSLP